MSDRVPPRRNVESLRKEAKRWHNAVASNDAAALERLSRAHPHAPANPSLRDIQFALAREHGYAGWTDLVAAAEARGNSPLLAHYEDAARALLDAYNLGTDEAMARHHRLTWHRRAWKGMRQYVQLDLGKRAPDGGDDVHITLDEARYLVAREHGAPSWEALQQQALETETLARTRRKTVPPAARPIHARLPDGTVISSRDWHELVDVLDGASGVALHAHDQLTDDAIALLAGQCDLQALAASGSRRLTSDGARHLAAFPTLRELDISGTSVTDDALRTVAALARLERLMLGGTSITDSGIAHLAASHALQQVNLAGTATGDGALRALAGKERLAHVFTGDRVTNDGIAAFRDFPAFRTWQWDDAPHAVHRDHPPSSVVLRGEFTDAGLSHLSSLEGLASLDVDYSGLALTREAMKVLQAMPNLVYLWADARDDWMPHIAAMPELRFLMVQDTVAGDDGFVALSDSGTIEHIWGRRCHNLRSRGFSALASMPSLQSLSVSCLNVSDEAIALLPEFPALRELMPMDIPDAGYRHIGRCDGLRVLTLMYCRDTTDQATEHITCLRRLTTYFNSYTAVTDRTPELLSTMPSLEDVTFDSCHNLTDRGIAALARLPRLRRLSARGRGLTGIAATGFPPEVEVTIGR